MSLLPKELSPEILLACSFFIFALKYIIFNVKLLIQVLHVWLSLNKVLDSNYVYTPAKRVSFIRIEMSGPRLE